MYQLIIVFYMFVCIGLVALVLIQHGKGADMGASFGSGASQTVFGSQGSGSFMLKLTGSLAAIFFALSLILGAMATHHSMKADSFLSLDPQVLPQKTTEELSEGSAMTATSSEDKEAKSSTENSTKNIQE